MAALRAGAPQGPKARWSRGAARRRREMGSQSVQPWKLLGRGASRLPGRAASNGDQRAVLRQKKTKLTSLL